jgi:hypothetical protein
VALTSLAMAVVGRDSVEPVTKNTNRLAFLGTANRLSS